MQHVEEHNEALTIGNHVKNERGKDPETIGNNFEIFKKCQSKLDCLIFEMRFFFRKLKLKLNNRMTRSRSYILNYFIFHVVSIALASFFNYATIFLYCFYANILEFLSVSLAFLLSIVCY